jgi:hypothetical protein
MVSRWQGRYLVKGATHLRRYPIRQGRKPPLSAEMIEQVVHKTLHEKPPAESAGAAARWLSPAARSHYTIPDTVLATPLSLMRRIGVIVEVADEPIDCRRIETGEDRIVLIRELDLLENPPQPRDEAEFQGVGREKAPARRAECRPSHVGCGGRTTSYCPVEFDRFHVCDDCESSQ